MSAPKYLYREIIKTAWQITWKNKSLWILGFFVTFILGGGVIEVIVRTFHGFVLNSWNPLLITQGAYPGAAFVSVLSSIGSSGTIIKLSGVLVGLIIFVILIGLLWVFSAAEGAMIWLIKETKKTTPPFKKGIMRGSKLGWKIFLVNVVSKLLVAAFFLLTSLPLILASQSSTFTNVLLYFISFIIFFPLVLIVSFMTIYTVCGLIIHNKNLIEAIENSWHLFRKNWLVSLETALILFGVSIVIGLAVALFTFLLSVPILILSIAAAVADMPVLIPIIVGLAIIFIVVLILIFGSIITTFQIASWTLLYERLSRFGGVSKLVRLFRSIPHLIFHRA